MTVPQDNNPVAFETAPSPDQPTIYNVEMPQGINFDLLVEQITAQIPNVGLNGGGNRIEVVFYNAPAPDEQAAIAARIEAICKAHDPTQLSAAQLSAIAQQQAAITLKDELAQVAARLATFKATTLDDVNTLAQDLSVLVQAIIAFY